MPSLFGTLTPKRILAVKKGKPVYKQTFDAQRSFDNNPNEVRHMSKRTVTPHRSQTPKDVNIVSDTEVVRNSQPKLRGEAKIHEE